MMRIYRIFYSAALLLICLNSFSQSLTETQKLQGYAVFGDKLTFIFDEKNYGVAPERVFVTGEFRNWDAGTKKSEWDLKKNGDRWILNIDNTDYGIVKPNSKFKFRINEGDWMSPPDGAENAKGGDLVFVQKDDRPSLKAELRSERLIWAEISNGRSLDPKEYIIKDASDNIIPVKGVLPYDSQATLVVPATDLDKRRSYWLEVPSLGLRTHCSFDGWFRETFSTKELGANIDKGTTIFRLFAPRATAVKLYLYNGKDDEKEDRVYNLEADEVGVWEIQVPEDLHGKYYDYTIHGFDEPGNNFFESKGQHVNDPYARVSDDTWGKARVWRNTIPASPLANGIPNMEDVIAYEVHIQDFTDNLPIEEKIKGTFKGMIKSGLKNELGEKIGFDHILDLGVNVVHLMPVQEYLHFPTDDWVASFKDDPYMISQGVNEENYQWGYRTTFALAVESRYRTKGLEPGEERDEFRDLVQAFHDQGIAVIIDIVPNHTGENMDGNEWLFNFNGIDKLYYYRTKDFEHIGAYGNEVKMEERPMTQRWIIDQCLHYINEFGIDGFRIDLAGQIDEQTLKALKEAIGPDKIVYGEAWIGSNDPNFEDNPDWDWYKADAPITFFQDDSRGAFKGPVFELKNKQTDRGWPGGKFDERENVMRGLSNTFPDDKTPLSGINYLDIHDNFALADQFGSEEFDGRLAVDQNRYKIAVALLYTSLGPIVTHGGSEIMRSKAAAPLKEVVKQTQEGYNIYMHGYRDTYNHRMANGFLWNTVGQPPNETNRNDYKNMYEFWRGMNRFRLSEYGKVFRVAEAVPEGYYQWILPEDESQLGYIVDNQVMVLINASEDEKIFEGIEVPKGKWRLIGNIDRLDIDRGVGKKTLYSKLKGGIQDFNMEPLSLLIWVRD